ncbi:MAG: hypothetical protein JWM47_2522 [Acidimicrobiales bacterium]|nr:hypothetical protein [Acidimicrobiales bacterium]
MRSAFSDPGRNAVVIYGPAGVGKTRLADSCGAQAVADGRLTARVVASHAAALLPLGALAPILPAASEPDATPAAVYEQARDELLALGGGDQLVLIVDDAHLLDHSSAVLLTQLLDAGAVFVMATIRDGEPLPDTIASWWRRPGTLRLDLRDLGPEGTEAVLTLVLGGDVGTDTIRTLHQASGGNPLLLRELVHQALAGGELSDESGIWRLQGTIRPSRRLVEVMATRLSTLTASGRRVVDQLAVCAPLSPTELVGEVRAQELVSLERNGFIRVVVDGSRHQLVLGHPLHGEVLRAELTVLRRQAILLAAADRIEALGARRREDARRVATWRLDGGGAPDADLLLQAARFARYANDFRQVQRLGTVLWARERTVEVAVLLGEAHYELGHFEEAEAILAAPLPAGAARALLVQRASLRGQNLQWGLGDWRAALTAAVEARETIGGDDAEDLLIREAGVWTFAGQPQKALDLIAGIEPRTARTRVLLAIAAGQALPMVGRTAEAVEVAIQGFAEHLDLAEPLALDHPGIHIVNHAFSLVEGGRFAEADELARLGYDMTIADNIPFAQIWFAMILGKSNTHQGRMADAQHWVREAASTARLHNFRCPERIACTALAAVEAQLGNVAAATAAIARADALPPFDLHQFDQNTARAWATWACGDPEGARWSLVENAAAAAAMHNVVAAAWAWHDAARLGASDVAHHLTTLADLGDSPVVAARAAHVRALEADDADGLAASSGELHDLGMMLLAAEAATSAANAYRRHGDQRAANSWANRAGTLALRCPGVRTPGLETQHAVVPLSAREREVATLAGQGIASQDIADQLFLSIRTVNNHLGSAYTKLGVHRREELADALGHS